MWSVVLSGLLAAAPSVALPGMAAVGLETGEAELYANLLGSGLRQRGLRVISSEDITAVLGMERQRQLMGCEQSCTAELAAALGADGVVIARVGLLGTGYAVSARVVSARNAEVLADATEQVGSAAAMPRALDHLAWALVNQLDWKWTNRGLQPGAEPGVTPAPSLRRWAWLPLAVGAVSLGVGVGLRLKAEGTLSELRGASTLTEAATLRDAGKLEQGLGFGLIGFGGAAALTALVFALVGPADAPAVALVPVAGGGVLSLGGVFP